MEFGPYSNIKNSIQLFSSNRLPIRIPGQKCKDVIIYSEKKYFGIKNIKPEYSTELIKKRLIRKKELRCLLKCMKQPSAIISSLVSIASTNSSLKYTTIRNDFKQTDVMKEILIGSLPFSEFINYKETGEKIILKSIKKLDLELIIASMCLLPIEYLRNIGHEEGGRLFITNVSLEMSSQCLKNIFSKFGQVVKLLIAQVESQETACIYVMYRRSISALKFLEAHHRKIYFGKAMKAYRSVPSRQLHHYLLKLSHYRSNCYVKIITFLLSTESEPENVRSSTSRINLNSITDTITESACNEGTNFETRASYAHTENECDAFNTDEKVDYGKTPLNLSTKTYLAPLPINRLLNKEDEAIFRRPIGLPSHFQHR